SVVQRSLWLLPTRRSSDLMPSFLGRAERIADVRKTNEVTRMRASTPPWRLAAQSLAFPYPRYLWVVVRQSALVWVLARLLIFFVLWLTGGIVVALHPNFATRAFLVAVTALLV